MVIHAPAPTRTVTLTIDGVPVTVPDGTTIWAAAKDAGIDIPVLCHDERYDPVGVCRMCVVDVGARAYAAACVRPCEDGMEVKTATPDVERNRATLTELLLADQPARERDPKQTTTGDNELLVLADHFGLTGQVGLPEGSGRGADLSNPVIAVDHDACILCDRCVRACDDIQGNDVIGRSGKGYATRIAFDLNDPMGASSCVTCGECVAACPTGALTNKPIRNIPIQPRSQLDQVNSVCPYCGVGCALTYHVDRERGAIAFAEGRDQPGSKGRLCVKGRYGWDYAASPQRLTVPLIRRDQDYPKGALSTDVRGEMNRADYAERHRRAGRAQAAQRGPRRQRHPQRPPRQRPGRQRRRRPQREAPPQARRTGRLRRGAAALPGGHLGRGAGPGGPAAHRDPRRRRAGRDRRLRLGQVLQRGGLPLPEADQDRLPHQQRGPLHPAVPRLQRVRAVRGHRLRRGVHHLRRRDQRRRGHRGRQQPDGQPPGGVVVLQAGPPPRHDDHLRRPAGRQDGRPRRHLLPAQARNRRRVLQRGHARGDQARADRPRVHREPDDELRGPGRDGQGLPAGARRPDHRGGRRHDPAGGAGLGRGQARA